MAVGYDDCVRYESATVIDDNLSQMNIIARIGGKEACSGRCGGGSSDPALA